MSARSFQINSSKRRFGNVTVERNETGVAVILHSTAVASLQNGVVTVQTGGWYTVTTKTVINRALAQFGLDARVFQRRGGWYVELDGRTVEFQDGMQIETCPVRAAIKRAVRS